MANAIAVLFAITVYLLLPLAIVYGWIRWSTRAKASGVVPILAFVGFVFATASVVLAIASVIYANHIGGFPFYDHRLMRIYAVGTLLSILGILSAFGGLWKRGPLRWLSISCACGTLIYWMGMAATE